MIDPETATHINGPKIAAWFKERDRMPVYMTGVKDEYDNLRRRIDRWALGEQAEVYTVDRWLTLCGCHLSEIPEEFYEAPHKKRYRRYTAEEKAEILRLVSEGNAPTEIARERQISPKTVWSWVRRAGGVQELTA